MARLMNSTSAQRSNTSYKVAIDCQSHLNKEDPDTADWLELTSKFDHQSADYVIFNGLLEKKNHIVAKIAFTANADNGEYEIAKELEKLRLPTLLNYYCRFECLDDRRSLNYSRRSLCKKTGERIHVIVMPYVDGGQINEWKWNRENFEGLKQVMKHIIYTLVHAVREKGFIHNDLHVGNVLMKKTKRKEISYGDLGSLEVEGYIPVIMDYDKASLSKEDTLKVYRDLNRLFTLFSIELAIEFDTMTIQNTLNILYSRKVEPSAEVCKELCKDVDKITIRFVKSEKPPIPNWLRPKKV